MSNNRSRKKVNSLSLFVLNLTKYFRLGTIVYFPVLLSALVLLIGFLVGEQIYENSTVPDRFIGTVFLIMSLTASVSGFIQIIIEEVPGLILPIQGRAAIIFGILWIAFFWSAGIYAIWYYFF
jgi:hypothetical protein